MASEKNRSETRCMAVFPAHLAEAPRHAMNRDDSRCLLSGERGREEGSAPIRNQYVMWHCNVPDCSFFFLHSSSYRVVRWRQATVWRSISLSDQHWCGKRWKKLVVQLASVLAGGCSELQGGAAANCSKLAVRVRAPLAANSRGFWLSRSSS